MRYLTSAFVQIFSRWVNQKLQSRNLPTLNDLITDLAEGENLPNLMFALSEKRMEAPKGSPKKMVESATGPPEH